MSAVAVPLKLLAHRGEHAIVRERAEQGVVALAGFVDSGHDCIHDAQARGGADALRREPGSRAECSRRARRMLERSGDRGAEGDDAASRSADARDCARRGFGNPIGLVEREASIERRVPGGGEPGGVRQCREADAAGPELLQELPVEKESGRRRLERRGKGGDAGPDVPDRERLLEVCVLDRLSVAEDAGPDLLGRTREADREKARVTEGADHRGLERAQVEHIAG